MAPPRARRRVARVAAEPVCHLRTNERDVRGLFILDRIAEQENIEVSEQEINEELEEYAQSRGETVAAAKARLTKEDALDSIKEQVRHQKALDLVIASAELTTEEIEGLRAPDAQTSQPQEDLAEAEVSSEPTAEATTEANPIEPAGE